MGTGIYGDPNDYEFGLAFNYALWTAGTVINLVNVPFNNDYRDVVKFPSKDALNNYINDRATSGITISEMSLVKPNEPVRIDVPLNKALRYNYLRASNPLMPIEGDIRKDYYYFILDARYIAPNTTELVLQLDVWQTYVYDVTIGSCWVERGHIGLANEKRMDNYGRDYLTVPEGLDVNGEYRVVAVRNENILTPSPVPLPDSDWPGYDVLVVSTTDLLADPGTVENPNLVSADGTTFQSTTQGANIYVFDPQQFYFFMNAMQDSPWVTQGIVSVTMIPKITRYHPEFEYSELTSFGKLAETAMPRTRTYGMFENWRKSDDILNQIPERYRHLDKFLTYPYMIVEMTTHTATPIIVKPESWNTRDGRVFERATLLPPGQRVEIGPRFYNSRFNNENQLPNLYPEIFDEFYDGVKGDDEGDYVDIVTQIANFPSMTVVNNGQMGYLASNTHGIAFQRQSAEWTQNRTMAQIQAEHGVNAAGIQSGLTQQNLGITADYGQTSVQNALLGQQATTQAIADAIGGVGSGGAFGGKRGAMGMVISSGASGIASGINTGAQIDANETAASIRNNAAGAQAQMQANQGNLANDTNRRVAEYASRGDYANAIAGVNARVQDAALIQPTSSGQMGGEMMNIVNGGWKFSVRWKMIDKAAMKRVGEFWLRYGYQIQARIDMPQSMMVMKKFTYWKTLETYISASNVPEGMKQAIRGIFEKGVTIWNHPDTIGDFNDNEPLGGVYY